MSLSSTYWRGVAVIGGATIVARGVIFDALGVTLVDPAGPGTYAKSVSIISDAPNEFCRECLPFECSRDCRLIVLSLLIRVIGIGASSGIISSSDF